MSFQPPILHLHSSPLPKQVTSGFPDSVTITYYMCVHFPVLTYFFFFNRKGNLLFSVSFMSLQFFLIKPQHSIQCCAETCSTNSNRPFLNTLFSMQSPFSYHPLLCGCYTFWSSETKFKATSGLHGNKS